MTSQQQKDDLLQHLEQEVGEEYAEEVYNGLPEHVQTPEDFEEFALDHAQGLGESGKQEGLGEPGADEGTDGQEPVVNERDESDGTDFMRQAQPLMEMFTKSQELQKRIEKEKREKELEYQNDQFEERLEFQQRAQGRWMLLLSGILVMVFFLILFFGWRSLEMGLEVFRTITVAVVSGLGGYGIGRAQNSGS
ncbi:hypothetical protein [Salinibacter ruber]|uniref:hypothetical protein n=1 Tax=Salinibacter ruber TaxID=146919 RepID=UPI000E58C83F|nr:hypothetical protein [Salinibacter ruber]